MRRAVLALIGTVAGTTLLVGARLGTPPRTDADAATLDADASAAASGGVPPAAGAVPGTTGSAPSTRAPAPSGTGRPAPAPAPTTPAAAGLRNGTYTGPGTWARRYEVVTVTVTVSGGKITVASGSCGDASGESRDICTRAVAKLQQETLAAQSARIATVSGATYTSTAYWTSLQAALDQAKA